MMNSVCVGCAPKVNFSPVFDHVHFPIFHNNPMTPLHELKIFL